LEFHDKQQSTRKKRGGGKNGILKGTIFKEELYETYHIDALVNAKRGFIYNHRDPIGDISRLFFSIFSLQLVAKQLIIRFF
jgi:hypothetical protein